MGTQKFDLLRETYAQQLSMLTLIGVVKASMTPSMHDPEVIDCYCNKLYVVHVYCMVGNFHRFCGAVKIIEF